MAMTNTIPQNCILTRWVGKGHPIVDAINQSKSVVGTVYQESGYSSTSADVDFKWMKGDIRIQIKTPKGTKGLAFGSQYDLRYDEEYEFLLPKNTAFLVNGYDEKTKTVIVEIIQ